MEGLFKEFAESWLNGKVGIKEGTKINYVSIVKLHLLPYFGQARISNLKREDIRDFVRVLIDEKLLSRSQS